VAPGDAICDIQTDKAVMSLEVDEEGILAKIIKSADSGSIKVAKNLISSLQIVLIILHQNIQQLGKYRY